jgi:HlyD family secretion protein
LRLIRWFLLVVVLAAVAASVYLVVQRPKPTIPFAAASRGDITSVLLTNGQVEPLDSSAIHAAASGRVRRILASQGQTISTGAVLLQLEDDAAEGETRDAEAALSAAQARLRQVQEGGSPMRRQELQGLLDQARLTLSHAIHQQSRVSRLVQANAATLQELEAEQRQVAIARERAATYEAQLRVLRTNAELADADAAVVAAQARLDAARRRVDSASLRSAATGTLFEFAAKPGDWLRPGDLVGRVGNLETVSVRVYVDEPELGRVRAGMPVTIRWDGLAGASWKGAVDRLPTRIQNFGTRQVGEVLCRIENPSRNLLPGANINAEIITGQQSQAVLVPKQAIRRRLGDEGVWKLTGDTIRWQPVRTGISSVTEAQVLEGVREGDRVALLVDRELRDGMAVQPQDP